MEEKKNKKSTFKAEEMRWLDSNEAYLEEHFPGMWVAIDGSRMVGLGKTLDEAEAQALEQGIDDPLFAVVTAREYQGKIMIR